MPPTFLYGMALMLWVALAIAAWIIAAFLVLLPSKRRVGLCLAAAVAGTFPGVIACQIIAAPVVLGFLVFIRFFWKAVEPGAATTTANPVVILVSIIAAFVAFSVFAGMSLMGFWEGCRAGWAVARGESIASALRGGPMIRAIRFLAGGKARRREKRER